MSCDLNDEMQLGKGNTQKRGFLRLLEDRNNMTTKGVAAATMIQLAWNRRTAGPTVTYLSEVDDDSVEVGVVEGGSVRGFSFLA